VPARVHANTKTEVVNSPSTAAASIFHSTGLRELTIVLLAAASLFLVGLGTLPLLEPDEGRNAEVAREMLVSGDWITPHFDALPYLDKPAIFFWLLAGSMRIFGVSEWVARFPAALTAAVTAALVWLLAKRMFQRSEPPGSGSRLGGAHSSAGDETKFPANCALLAALVWITCPLVIAFARQVILDMPLTLALTSAMVCFWFATNQRSEGDGLHNWFLNVGFFGSMGIATFVKGPVGMLVPLLSISLYQVVRGRFSDLRQLRWGLGAIIFLAVTLPWFVTVSLRNPAFPHYAIWEEIFLRFTTDHLHRRGGLFYYVPVFLLGVFPWSFCLLFAAWNRVRKWSLLKQDRYRAELFLLLWAGVVLVFFSISRSKLPGYILPATVPLSILMARIWIDVERRDLGRTPDWLSAGFAAMIALGILVAASPQFLRFAGLQRLVRHKVPPNVLPFLNPEVFFTGVILAATGILGRSVAHRYAARPKLFSLASFILLAVSVPSLLIRWAVPIRGYAEAYSSRQLGRAILNSPEKNFAIYGYYYFRTGLPFYLSHPVGIVTSGGSESTSNYVASQFQSLRRAARPDMGQANGPGLRSKTKPEMLKPANGSGTATPAFGRLLIDSSELRALSKSSVSPFLVIARNGSVPDVVKTVESAEPLWSAWEYSVLKIPPARSRRALEPVMIDRVVRYRR
jgi:4-amino-4-deoxy-L-arabinose transferase-like glycosyltransferase